MQTVKKKRANSAYRNYTKTATKRIPTDFFNQVGYFTRLLDAQCRLECRVILSTDEGAIDMGSVAFDASGFVEGDPDLSLIQKIENLHIVDAAANSAAPIEPTPSDHAALVGADEFCLDLPLSFATALGSGTANDPARSPGVRIDLSKALAGEDFLEKPIGMQGVRAELRSKLFKLCLFLASGI
jgi:hypothetical protein